MDPQLKELLLWAIPACGASYILLWELIHPLTDRIDAWWNSRRLRRWMEAECKRYYAVEEWTNIGGDRWQDRRGIIREADYS